MARGAVKIHGLATVDVIDADPQTGKPYLKLSFDGGVVVYITTNLAEMIGGIGAGVRQRQAAKGMQ